MACFGSISIQRPGGSGSKDRISVPCGKCAGCLSQARSDWTFRLKQELKYSLSSCFVTLTYDDEKIPMLNGVATLKKRDVQLFLKRLRKVKDKGCYILSHIEKVAENAGKQHKIRYLIVGEYGPETQRPHYHGILFNVPIHLKMDKIWNNGFIHEGSVTDASIHYTTSYVLNRFNVYEDKEPGFMIMSRKPGLGSKYLDIAKTWHEENQSFYVVNEGGFKQRLPRFYKNKLFTDSEIENNSVLLHNIYNEKMEKQYENIAAKGVNPFTCIEERKKSFTRNLQKTKNKKL